MKYHWAVGFEPTPASTAAPSPSQSGDITTAPLHVKSKLHATVLCLIYLLDPSNRVYFGALAHALYIRNSLDPQDTEA